MSVKSVTGSRVIHRKILLAVSLIAVLLVASFVAYTWLLADKDYLHVKSENELRKAVNNVKIGAPIVIILDRDISLTEGALVIPRGIDVTLSSNSELASDSGVEFFKLIGASGSEVLAFEGTNMGDGGVLRIDGIIVTHVNGDKGSGVGVGSGCTFIMYNGEISGNIGDLYTSGFGVCNFGTFELHGGEISGNTAHESGGGVCNYAVFKMFGGKISNNKALNGGGVHNTGSFEMTDGVISGNVAVSRDSPDGSWFGGEGGGVYNGRSFNMLGGEIFGNTARRGGGVCVDFGFSIEVSFSMSGGKVSGNTADVGNDLYEVPRLC